MTARQNAAPKPGSAEEWNALKREAGSIASSGRDVIWRWADLARKVGGPLGENPSVKTGALGRLRRFREELIEDGLADANEIPTADALLLYRRVAELIPATHRGNRLSVDGARKLLNSASTRDMCLEVLASLKTDGLKATPRNIQARLAALDENSDGKSRTKSDRKANKAKRSNESEGSREAEQSSRSEQDDHAKREESGTDANDSTEEKTESKANGASDTKQQSERRERQRRAYGRYHDREKGTDTDTLLKDFVTHIFDSGWTIGLAYSKIKHASYIDPFTKQKAMVSLPRIAEMILEMVEHIENMDVLEQASEEDMKSFWADLERKLQEK